MIRQWRWPARVVAVAGSGLVLGWVFRKLDLAALAKTLGTLEWGWYLAAHGVFFLGLIVAGLRWHLMLRLNPKAVVHGTASVRMVLISQFFNTVFGGPSGGDLPKTAVYSKWFGVPAADVLAASVLDRLVSSVGGLLFASMAISLGLGAGGFEFLKRWEWRWPGLWAGAVAFAGASIVAGILTWGVRRPESFVGRSLGSFWSSVRRLAGSGRRSGQALACGFATAVCFNLTQVVCLTAVSTEPVSWPKVLWMYHLISAAAALPVSVAGTGMREGASMVLLSQQGISAATSVAGALLTLSIHVSWAIAGAGLLMWEQRARRGSKPATGMAGISVVVPVLNEAGVLAATLERLRRVPEVLEILVVDGGSTDGTSVVAERMGCRVMSSAKGRGTQMGVGARAARGDVVWMVHADTWVEPEAGDAIFRCLRDPLVVGGGFWKRFDGAPWVMRGSRFRCWVRLAFGNGVLGDQALFVRRSVLEAVGGVPDLPIMEEVELCSRLLGRGRLALAGGTVTTSMRRFRGRGILRTYRLMWKVSRGFRKGVPPRELARWYEGS